MNNTRLLLSVVLDETDEFEREAQKIDANMYNRSIRRIVAWRTAYPHRPLPASSVHWSERDFRVWAGQLPAQEPEGAEEEFEPSEPSLLACPKCHQHRVDHFTKQTRSADEPETIFAHCLACGHRWRQNG